MKSLPLLAICIAWTLASAPTFASASEEPLLEELEDRFKSDALSLGALIQVVADAQKGRAFGGANGFSLANLRLNVGGMLDGGVGYFIQTNLVGGVPFLDGRISWTVIPEFRLTTGLFKVPVSGEYLIGADAIDFVNRAQVVGALAPGRQLGVQADGTILDGSIYYAVGLFNGNPFAQNLNDGNGFLVAARTAAQWQFGEEGSDAFIVGVSGAQSSDDSVPIVGGAAPAFSGQQLVGSADARLQWHGMLVSAEALIARFSPPGAPTFEGYGYHATAGYHFCAQAQALVRWDSFRAPGLVAPSDWFIAGLNVWPTRATEVQVNLVVPTRLGAEFTQLLMNFQVGF